jgi:hypothetical protein
MRAFYGPPEKEKVMVDLLLIVICPALVTAFIAYDQLRGRV